MNPDPETHALAIMGMLHDGADTVLLLGPHEPGFWAHFTAQPMVAEGSYFWFGGEESLVVPLRRHVRRALDAERQRVYAVPYWRSGKDEDAYHQDRHAVMDG